MAVTETHLCNLALSAIGMPSISSIDDNASKAARKCKLWLEPVRRMVFEAAPWTGLEAYKRLALLATRDEDEDWIAADPTPGYAYAYAKPSDMVRPRYFSDYSLFKVGATNGQSALISNAATPILFYTRDVTNPVEWDSGLQMAVVFALAAHVCKDLTGKDTDLQNMMMLAQEKANVAIANDSNYNQDTPQDTVPDWLAARGMSLGAPSSRYVYPPGQLTLMSNLSLG